MRVGAGLSSFVFLSFYFFIEVQLPHSGTLVSGVPDDSTSLHVSAVLTQVQLPPVTVQHCYGTTNDSPCAVL